jgi:glycerophosphoryl diester phosphodiesterase
MIIAHRGYVKNFKENTIAAFDAALIAGADAIETDVRLTRDNHVVISHDDEVSIDGKNIII